MEKSNNGLRVILFPLPLQGCINPMLQLANILHSRNFSITVIHTRFNAPKSSNHPHFDFLQIEDGVSETQDPTWNVMSLLAQINRDAKSPFHDCLQKLLLQSQESEKISCLIDDCGWLFTQSVSESLNLPRLVLSTFKATFLNGYPIIPLLRTKGYLPFSESEAEDSVFDFLPLKKRDLSKVLVGEYEEELYSFLSVTVETTMRSSGIIFMSCEELEKDSLIRSNEIYKVPVFAVGPFHSYFSASSSSLFAQDVTCVPWLDNQEDKSVIYVSLGSVVNISESEFLEIANGLNNSKQPFLWVVRPGLVQGVEWIKLLSEELLSSLGEKGKIVKWAPQQEVLAHRAIGGFLTHNGWNSTLESICEGVPMICLPGGWDQMLNSRFVSDVWKVGIHLEGRIERNEIEKAVRLLMTETEGRKFRERMNVLKDKVAGSVKHGGSSFRSIETLTNHILSL